MRDPFRSFLLVFGLGALLLVSGCANIGGAGGGGGGERLRREVDALVLPLMEEHRIPGMAVAVVHGDRVDLFCYGVASLEAGAKVDERTLFEVGSVSKLFTGLLGAHVSARGCFGMDDHVGRVFPALAGNAFDSITMAQLATYSAGGLPLQFPGGVTNDDEMLAYFRAWAPEHAPGAQRLYSNPSIGLFGRAAAGSAENFSDLMTGVIFPALGLRHTYLAVPPSEMDRYAFGYDRDDRPVRVNPGVLDAEAYGVKTTIADMARFVRAQMVEHDDPLLAGAIARTRVGLLSVGPMTQGLGWEIYAWPATLDDRWPGSRRRSS